MTQNICFFGIVNCDPLVTRKIIGISNIDRRAITTVGYLSWDMQNYGADMHSVHVTYDHLLWHGLKEFIYSACSSTKVHSLGN